MAAPASSHMVGRCFQATEAGSYFDGSGFLKAGVAPTLCEVVKNKRKKKPQSDQSVSLCVQVSSYRVGLDMAISFEFRTSKTSGVLLAVSNQASDGLGIEIVQGKVLKAREETLPSHLSNV